MVNPFGEESDSKIAWQQKYQQMEFQANTLRQIVAETKVKLNATTEERDMLLTNNQAMDAELSQTKQDLLIFKKLAKERAETIAKMETSMNTSEFSRMGTEIDNLRSQIAELQSDAARSTPEEAALCAGLLTPHTA